MKTSRSHHLAKHSLADEVDVQLHFGSTDPKEISREVAKLGQKQLQVCHLIGCSACYGIVGKGILMPCADQSVPAFAGKVQPDILSKDIQQQQSVAPAQAAGRCALPTP